MTNFILLIICFCSGMAFRRSGKLPDNAHATLNGVIIYLSLPALILLHLHDLHFSKELLYAAVMPWCLFLIGALFFRNGEKDAIAIGVAGVLSH